MGILQPPPPKARGSTGSIFLVLEWGVAEHGSTFQVKMANLMRVLGDEAGDSKGEVCPNPNY